MLLVLDLNSRVWVYGMERERATGLASYNRLEFCVVEDNAVAKIMQICLECVLSSPCEFKGTGWSTRLHVHIVSTIQHIITKLPAVFTYVHANL